MSQGGHIVKARDKRRTWAIMYRDPDGQLRWEGKFATKGDGQRRLNEVLGQIDKGVYARPTSMTFEQFAENWLVGRRKIRGSTESGYGSLIKRQLSPAPRVRYVSPRFAWSISSCGGIGMIEDELSSKTIHNCRDLYSVPMLAGKKAVCRAASSLFRDPTLGLELPPLTASQITPPTPEQTWAPINAAKVIGGIGLSG